MRPPRPRPDRFGDGLLPPPDEAERRRQEVEDFRGALELVRRDEVSLDEARALLDRIATLGRHGPPPAKGGAL